MDHDERRDCYDATDMTASIENAVLDDTMIDADEIMVTTSIRLPRSHMQRLRKRADREGIPTSALIRRWVLDRLDAEST